MHLLSIVSKNATTHDQNSFKVEFEEVKEHFTNILILIAMLVVFYLSLTTRFNFLFRVAFIMISFVCIIIFGNSVVSWKSRKTEEANCGS